VSVVASERRIVHAIQAGEHNRSTMELVRNWCAHARIEKFGGVGLIEAETGLPIGHHSVKCDHASEAGIASWDLREAALDFHDRNCADCKLRKPLGFPNLSQLIQERNSRREAEARRQAREEANLADGLHARRTERSKLRETLGPVAGAILDHIDEFDEHRTREHHDRICESARLAPERFEVWLVKYIFDLAEKEQWFADTALTVLQAIKADPLRLTRLALSSIVYPPATRTASNILLEHIELVDAPRIDRALPSIIDLARPRDEPLHRPAAEPQLLQALWESYREPVAVRFNDLFASRKVYHVDLAARGMLAIGEKHDDAAAPFARTMVSKFARARLLLDDFDDDDLFHDQKDLHNLLDAVSLAFMNDPDAVDAIVQEMIGGSDRKSRDRCYEIYRFALSRRNRIKSEVIPPDSQPHRIAFRRVLWAATMEESDSVLRTAQEVLRGQPYELEEIARAEIDGLLGALLILDDRLRKHDESALPENAIFLQRLERQNRRSSIISLMKSAIEWASIAAKNHQGLIKKIVALFDTIPEGSRRAEGPLAWFDRASRLDRRKFETAPATSLLWAGRLLRRAPGFCRNGGRRASVPLPGQCAAASLRSVLRPVVGSICRRTQVSGARAPQISLAR
jgi:hypothetical protein